MNTHFVFVKVQFKYHHDEYGDIYDCWVECGHHEEAYSRTFEQTLEFVQNTAASYERARAFNQDGQPVRYRVEVVWDGPAPSEIRLQEIEQAAENVRYLIVADGGMATKSRVEDYLIRSFGISRCLAHEIMNMLEVRNSRPWVSDDEHHIYWNQAEMMRSEPKMENFPWLAEMIEADKR